MRIKFHFFVTIKAKTMIPLLVCTLLFLSCEKMAVLFALREPARIMLMDQADEELVRIAEDAQNTLHRFFRQLNRPGAGESGFSVKYPFAVDDESDIGTEQVWLTNIQFKNGSYFGSLNSDPRYLNGKKKGDRVIFMADAITDWMYIRNGNIIGGYSIRYLLERIPEEQRSDSERKLLQMFN